MYKKAFEVKQQQLNKQAFGGAISGIAKFVGELGTVSALLLAAGLTATGVAAGGAAAKLTAKSKIDMDTAKKQFEDKRLDSDINTLRASLRAEYDKKVNPAAQPKAVRMFS